MPVAEVAATILPYFSSGSHVEEDRALNDILSWLMTGEYRQGFLRLMGGAIENQFQNPNICAVGEAMQVLEHAGLIRRVISGWDNTYVYVGLTRLGMHALQTNTVRQHLGLGDAPPTAL